MNKKNSINGKLYTLLAVAAILGNVANSAILAEDTVGSPEVPTEVISSVDGTTDVGGSLEEPTVPISSEITGEVNGNNDAGIDPAVPVETTPPSTSSEVPPESGPIDPAVPVDTTSPSTSSDVPPTSEPIDPSTTPAEEPTPVPTPTPTPPTTTVEEPTPVPAPVPAPPTTPAEDPTPAPKPIQEPIEAQNGDTIVGTQQGNVIVQQSDGSTQLKSAEAVGGTLNQDGTISITDSKGEKKTLPNTGVKENFLMSFIGLLMLFFGFGVLKPNKFN